jgi:hypothetical protein
MDAFLDKAGLIHNPCRHRSAFLHRRQDVIPHLPQHVGIAPGRLRDEVMQRLVHGLHMIGSQARSHGFDTLSLAVQQQTGTVIPQRDVAVSMPRGLRQPVHICREAFLLWCWRRGFRSHENIIRQICLL